MKDISGKTAFVTGAASGIGLALARALLARGANVMLADVNADALGKAQAQLDARERTATVICDVADFAAVQAAQRATVEHFGPTHLVFNNAGVSVAGAPTEAPVEDFRWVIDVNLMGVVHGVEAFVPHMLDHGQGDNFVNTASMAGHYAAAALGAYNASKFAVVGYSETIRQDLAAKGIGVSVLCPAWVKTRIHTAGAHRPSGVQPPVDPTTEAAVAMVAHAVETGINPDDVANWTLDCVEAGRFYVFTHPHMRGAFDARAGMIAADLEACAADPRFAMKESDDD